MQPLLQQFCQIIHELEMRLPALSALGIMATSIVEW
jgi:hypothetical protein